MSDTHTKTDIDLRLKAVREVTEMLGDMAKLIGRVRAVLDRLLDEVDELETLAADKMCPSCGHCMAHESDEHEPDCSTIKPEPDPVTKEVDHTQ